MHAIQQPTDYKKLLSRLCHLAVLSETKAIEGVLNSLVISVMEMDPAHPVGTQEEIDEALRVYFGVELDAKDLNASISRLTQEGLLIRQTGVNAYVLSPAARASHLQRVTAAGELEEKVRQQWLSSIRSDFDHWNEVLENELWQSLKAFLARIFRRHGAQTVLVVSGQTCDDAELDKSVNDLLKITIAEECKVTDQQLARQAVKKFLRQQSPDQAIYIAGLLDRTFSFYSLFTDEATQGYLKESIPRIIVFLDTNFLFGFLNLHDNPQNEVSLELVSLVRSQGLPFELYYHEDSLLEMQETIDRTEKRLSSYKWPSGLSRAVLQTRASDLTGLELKYYEANAKYQVEPNAFFTKFRHVERILQEAGFKIYRRHAGQDREKLDPKTSELVSQYTNYLDRVLPPNRHRTFNAVKHDIIVWSAAKSLRKPTAAGLDVGALFLSADTRLFAFDWGELSADSHLGVVVLPSQLLQLLRPFVARSSDFDTKFSAVFALPEFSSGNSDFSQVTRRVLGYLATVSDLSEETAVAILADEILLRRLKNIEGDEEVRDVIESEVLRKNAELAELHRDVSSQLEAATADVSQKQRLLEDSGREIESKNKALAEHAAQIEREKSERARKEQEAEVAKEEAAKAKQQLEATAQSLDAKNKEAADLAGKLSAFEDDKAWNRKVVRAILSVVFTVGVWITIWKLPQIQEWEWLQKHEHKKGIYLAAFLIAPALAWAIFGWKGKVAAIMVVILACLCELIGIV